MTMKMSLLTTLAGAIPMLMSVNATAQPADADLIRSLLRSYERVLNASDVDGVLELYTDDGVFMAQNNPSAVGRQQVGAAYASVFDAIDLNVTFDIVEVEVIAPTWAFARTNSSGVTTINATGEKVSEANQELFVLQKVDGDWKIARYGFSTTNPAR
jgi:uncharacterized protein (TIGR02246 family)